ncbi:serine-rich adhesin for platelets-like isoform X2 [Mya arenaria]|uniref:serine-rich adhesin for platelets-like isoform X2 n=1 Tax=Mya arenaria TaxID=6604 RepID=UPI0022E336DE|nr:serine-rich adhesin for platelets-like isoform X2 [Mya arenaria]
MFRISLDTEIDTKATPSNTSEVSAYPRTVTSRPLASSVPVTSIPLAGTDSCVSTSFPSSASDSIFCAVRNCSTTATKSPFVKSLVSSSALSCSSASERSSTSMLMSSAVCSTSTTLSSSILLSSVSTTSSSTTVCLTLSKSSDPLALCSSKPISSYKLYDNEKSCFSNKQENKLDITPLQSESDIDRDIKEVTKSDNTDCFGFATLTKERSVIKDSHGNLKPNDSTESQVVQLTSSQCYKASHPIGSRKVTENVITYHESMFQSVANRLFENQKNLMMGKRKADDLSMSAFSETKKVKTSPGSSPAATPPSMKSTSKKKSSIENIIERIRTEKTMSRGGHSGAARSLVLDTAGPDLPQFSETDTSSLVKKENKGNEFPSSAIQSDSEPIDLSVKCPKENKCPQTESKDFNAQSENASEDTSIICLKDEKQDLEITAGCAPAVPKVKDTDILMVNLGSKKMKKSNDAPAVPKVKDTDILMVNLGSKKMKKSNDETETKPKSPSKTDDSHKGVSTVRIQKIPKQCLNKSETDKTNKEKKKPIYMKQADDTEKKEPSIKQLDDTEKKKSSMKQVDEKEKKISGMKQADDKEKGKTSVKQEDDKEKKRYGIKQVEDKEKKKSSIKQEDNQKNEQEQIGGGAKMEKQQSKSAMKKEEQQCIKRIKSTVKKYKKNQSPEEKKAAKIMRQRKNKLPIACRRTKREASLNAATLVNILCEKAPRTPKLEKRSKSDSDIKMSPAEKRLFPSVSISDIGFTENVQGKSSDAVFTDTKKDGLNSSKFYSKPKSGSTGSVESFKVPVSPTKKEISPKKKRSASADDFESVFQSVIRRSIRETEGNVSSRGRKPKSFNEKKSVKNSMVKNKRELSIESKSSKAKLMSFTEVKKKSINKIKKAIKVTVAKSVEEKAEKKRKAALARLARAKELVKTKKKLSGEFVSDQSSGGSDSESLASENVDVEAETSTDTDGNCENNQSKAKKGALFRAARTHVAVESKTVVENTMPSPRWCECCQSTYYPSQPSQNTQVWRIKQLVDKDTSNAPAQIQSSSNHFIAAHASCEVRPYSSPSHVSVLDSNPYVGQLVPHGRIQCSACSCGHSGMFHTSCQNCSLGGVLPCQRYGNTYSVTYPHSHGSYIHCGCGSCYSSGTYHHTVGQTTLIHQPQMPLSTESPILLHHPVPIQVTHDSPLNSHPVSLTTLAPHDPPSLTHQLSKPASHPGEPSKGVGGLPQSQASSPGALSRMCQLSQGEVTNVSILASSSPTHSDHEIVDVGSREDIVKSAPCLHLEQAGISVVKSTFIKKTNSNNQPVKREKDKSIDQAKKKKVKFSTQNDKPVSIEKKKKNIEILKEKAKKLSLLNTKKDKKSENVKFSSHSHKTNENKVKKDKQQQIKVPIVPKDGSKKSKRTVSGPKEPKSQTGFLEIGIGDKERAEVKVWHHGWIWDGEAVSKKVINIFDGQPVQRKCYQGIVHEDGDSVQVKDCVLVCAGRKDRDLPYVAKVTNLWEEPTTGEMMMSVLWFYRPEHAEGGRRPEHLLNEVFAAKHRDETGVACIEDKGYVLTYNEYCRYMAEVERVRSSQPPRVSVVPTHEDPYPHHRIPPVDADPETIFLCRQVYDIKLKRVLKNPS